MKLNKMWLCELPNGWIKRFGSALSSDLEEMMDKGVDVLEVKEKYGELRIYCAPSLPSVNLLIDEYKELSKRTCCQCGKEATKVNVDWICPWCDECAAGSNGEFVDIEEWLS